MNKKIWAELEIKVKGKNESKFCDEKCKYLCTCQADYICGYCALFQKDLNTMTIDETNIFFYRCKKCIESEKRRNKYAPQKRK